MTKHDNDYIGFDARQNLPFTVDALFLSACIVWSFLKKTNKKKHFPDESDLHLVCLSDSPK